ncbi:MAG: glycoside hydrolase family 9 protein [Saprospiraceae bacterium]|nr:glycoside hydrolase family 9 protein [Saprospiraceae bacterium]
MRQLPLFLTITTIQILILSCSASPHSISLNIKVDQFGYRPNDTKVAVIAQPKVGYNAPSTYSPGSVFKVRNWDTDAEVFSGAAVLWKNGTTHTQSGDKVWWFDFSALTTEGAYYVQDVETGYSSDKFVIHKDIYTSILRAATHALFYQRCGIDITYPHGNRWTHTACHMGANQDLACRDVQTPNTTSSAKDLSGGWHDAGDYNKYVNYSYNAVHNLLFAYQETPSVFGDDWGIPESKNGVPDVLDEVKYELDWLLKMQQTDGSVLSKVSVVDFVTASPPNNDAARRYYGKVSTSSTLSVASMFAHAAIVFQPINPTYAATLLAKAQSAWSWAVANPSVTYANTGFQSSSPELEVYDISARKIGAAALLFAATNQTAYKTFFESNYSNLEFVQSQYYSSFEATYNDISLYYATLSGASSAVKTNILTAFNQSTLYATDLLPSFTNKTDAYRAHMNDVDYVWGSNMQKALLGNMYEGMIRYNQSTAQQANFRTIALDYLHFLHGVNAMSLVMLSNTKSIGADNCVTQIYHGWTGDKTAFDLDPIPALMTGGINKNYSVHTISPPYNQPIQKMYKDWNTSDTDKSWEITEPAVSYQAAYIRLVSKFATRSALSPVENTLVNEDNTPLSIFPNPTDSSLSFQFGKNINEDFTVQIVDLFGKIHFSEKHESVDYQSTMVVNTESMADGNYILNLKIGSMTYAKKFQIIH